MAVQSETNKSGPYLGDDVTVDFPITFSIASTSDVQVVETVIATGVDTIVTSGFTINVALSKVTYNTAPPSTKKITLRIGTPTTQTKDYVSFGGIQADEAEDSWDKLTRQNLRQDRENERSLKVGETETASTVFPPSSASSFIGWNSAGDALENKDVVNGSDIVISAGDAGKIATVNSGEDNLEFVYGILDEDDMVSDSATAVPTQQSTKKYIDDGLLTKVGTTGDETIAGEKTFSTFPITPSAAPDADYEVANKKYVDDSIVSVDAQQLCKGWVNFNGTGTVAIRDSFNVSSVVDAATGRYTINWDTDFADANYCSISMCSENVTRQNNQQAASLQIETLDATPILSDPSIVCVAAYGDQ